MDPFVLFAIAAWLFVRYPFSDAVAAYTGHESPRRRDKRERQQRRHDRAMAVGGGPTITEALATRIAQRIATPRERAAAGDHKARPARDYASEVWRDAWLAAGERHRTHGDRKASGLLPRQRAARAARRAWAAHRPNDGARPWTGPVRQPSQRDDRCPDCHQSEAAHCPDCEACDPGPDCARGTCVIADPPPAPEPAPEPDPDPEPPTSDPLASVTPIRPEDITMTAPTATGPGSGETVDPEQAKAFADQLAAVFQRAHDECETSIATLTEHGVTGEPIAKLTSIQEKVGDALTEAQAASTYFSSHIDAADAAQAAQQSSGAGGGRYLGVGA